MKLALSKVDFNTIVVVLIELIGIIFGTHYLLQPVHLLWPVAVVFVSVNIAICVYAKGPTENDLIDSIVIFIAIVLLLIAAINFGIVMHEHIFTVLSSVIMAIVGFIVMFALTCFILLLVTID